MNKWRSWDFTTEFTSRGNVNSNVGWVSQALRPSELAGVTELSFIQYVVQDQDLSTVEPWDLQWTLLDGAGVPDYATAASVKIIVANLALARGVGIGAFLVTHNLNANAAATFKIPSTAGTAEPGHITWSLKSTPPPSWSSDGLGIHMSQSGNFLANKLCQTNAQNQTVHREIPRTERINNQITQPNIELAWSGSAGSPPVVPTGPLDRAWRLDVGTTIPVLSVASENKAYNANSPGCLNPNTGYAGLFPDFNDEVGNTPKRFDNPAWIINAGASNGNGVAILLMSSALGSSPLAIPGWGGALYLDLGDPLLLATAGLLVLPLNINGSATLTLPLGPGGGSNVLRPLLASLINWHFQVAVISKKGASFSSLATMTPTLNNKGKFMQGTTVKGTPLKITGASVKNVLVVRNDGHATLIVREKNGNTTFKSTIVPEGSSVRIRKFPAAIEISIESNKTKKSKLTWNWES